MKVLKRALENERFFTNNTLEEDVYGEEDNESDNQDDKNESVMRSASEVTE